MPSAYATRILADGATAYWPLNEASGNVTDIIGGVVGTPSGDVTYGYPGIAGGTAMAFGSQTGQIVIPNGAYQACGTGPVTIEVKYPAKDDLGAIRKDLEFVRKQLAAAWAG